MDDKWVKYEYSFLPTAGSWIKEPRVQVVLTDGKRFRPEFAMIDSGAHTTMIDLEIMEVLGIEKSSCRLVKVGGIVGDLVDAFLSDMSMTVDGFDDPIKLPVLFVPKLKTGMLLGQIGFFENFKIRFENSNDCFYLAKKDPQKKKGSGSNDKLETLLGGAVVLNTKPKKAKRSGGYEGRQTRSRRSVHGSLRRNDKYRRKRV